MSLRKGLALLMVAAFGLASPAQAITISTSNTTSSTLEAYILPGNSTADNIITQTIGVSASATEATKGYTNVSLATVGNEGGDSNTTTLATTVAAAGKSLVTALQPAFTGSNQTQNWNVVVCETTAAGFVNGADFFVALPSGWDLNLENGAAAVATPGKVFTTAVSNGVTLATSVAGDLQEKTSALRAGIAVHISDVDDNGATTSNNNRDCFAINIQHENVIAPSASSTAATANVYTYNGTTTLATDGIIAAAGTTTTDITFASSILANSATVALANGNDLISSFVRTGSTEANSTETPTQSESIADGAIQQTQLGSTAPTSVLRYRTQTGNSKIPGLVISESNAGAWNLLNGHSVLRPASTLVNGAYAYAANADTLAANGSYVVVRCETNGDGTVSLAGTPVVSVLGTDLDSDESEVAVSAGQLTINIAKRTGSLADPNQVASRLLVTGLTINSINGSTANDVTTSSLECFAHARRQSESSTAANGVLLESIASAEGVTTSADTAAGNKLVAMYTSNGEAATQEVYKKWARSQGVAGTAEAAYSNSDTNANNGSSAFFSAFTGTTIGGASVANGTTAMKTVKATTQYGLTLASLPSASSASGDTDKLVTITIAENSLSAGLPVTATGVTTNDGPADVVTVLAGSNGSAKLAIRSKSGSAITLTAPYLTAGANTNGTLSITATAATITPAFTSTAITSELDSTDGFVKRGSLALLVFTVSSANTVGFTFSDYVDSADVNGSEVIRFGTTDKYAALVRPGSGSFTLTVDVDGTSVTKTITASYTAILTTSFPAHGKMKLADQRASKGRFVFTAVRNKFLDSVRIFEVDGDGVVTEAIVTLAAAKTKAIAADASDDTEFVCITSDRQTDCFDVR